MDFCWLFFFLWRNKDGIHKASFCSESNRVPTEVTMDDFLGSLPSRDKTNFSSYSTASRSSSRQPPKRPTVYVKTGDASDAAKPEGLPIRNEKTSILLRYMQQQQKQQEKEKEKEASRRKRRSPGKAAARRHERRKVPKLANSTTEAEAGDSRHDGGEALS